MLVSYLRRLIFLSLSFVCISISANSTEFKFFNPLKEYINDKNQLRNFMPNPIQECIAIEDAKLTFKAKWGTDTVRIFTGDAWAKAMDRELKATLLFKKNTNYAIGMTQFVLRSTDPVNWGRVTNIESNQSNVKLNELFKCYKKDQYEEYKSDLIKFRKIRAGNLKKAKEEIQSKKNKTGNIDPIRIGENKRLLKLAGLGNKRSLNVIRSLEEPMKTYITINLLNDQNISDMKVLQRNDRYWTVQIKEPTAPKLFEGFIVVDEKLRISGKPIKPEGISASLLKKIQESLANDDYFIGNIDGKIGKDFIKALNKWQIDNDRDVTIELAHSEAQAILDFYANKEIMELDIPKKEEKNQAESSNIEKLETNDTPVPLKELQEFLKILEFYQGAIDGDFGKNSMKSLNLWQVENERNVTAEPNIQDFEMIASQAKEKLKTVDEKKKEEELSTAKLDLNKIIEEYDEIDRELILTNKKILENFGTTSDDKIIIYKNLSDFEPIYNLDISINEHLRNLKIIDQGDNFIKVMLLPPLVEKDISGYIKNAKKIIIVETEKLPVPLKELQEFLKILEFYQGAIDGDFGKNSMKSLNLWQVENERNVTAEPNIQDFEMIASQAKEKLKTVDEKKKEEELSTAKLDKEKEIDAQIQKEMELEAQKNAEKLKKQKEQEKENLAKLAKEQKQNNEELSAAQIFINDLVDFIKTEKSNLDIIEVSRLINLNRPILEGVWSNEQKVKYEELKSFAEKNENFNEFLKLRENERNLKIENDLAMQSEILSAQVEFFSDYLSKNITSEIVPNVIEIVEKVRTALSNQNLDELIFTNNIVDEFINENNLQKLREEFEDIPESLLQEEKPTFEEQDMNIKAELDLYPFFETASEKDYIAFINLTESAPHAYFDIEGNIVFEQDRAYTCMYETTQPEKELFYFLVDSIAQNKFNMDFLATDLNCSKDLLEYDLVIVNKRDLYNAENYTLQKMIELISDQSLFFYKSVEESKYIGEIEKRKNFASKIEKDLKNPKSERSGYGSFVIDNENTVLCSDVNSNLRGHNSILNLLKNEFDRLGFGKEISEKNFKEINEIARDIQRNECGFVYAEASSLSKFVNLLEKLNKNYNVIPIWFTSEQVEEEEEKKEKLRIEKLKKEEELNEKAREQEILTSQKKENEKALLEASDAEFERQQKELRIRSEDKVKEGTELVRKNFESLYTFLNQSFKDNKIVSIQFPKNKPPFESDYVEKSSSNFIWDAFPRFADELNALILEDWIFETDETFMNIFDYGISDWKGRLLETFIVDLNYTIKNNLLGEYRNYCKRISYMNDVDFKSYRKLILSECNSSFDDYKKQNSFKSYWYLERN